MLLQFGLSSLLMVGALYAMLPYFPTHGSQLQRVLVLLLICGAGALVYAVTLLATGFRPKQLRHG